MRRMIPYLRRGVQALSFCFLIYLILKTAFPLELKIPVDLYLRLDPFIGIVTILTKKGVILRMLPAFGVLLLVMIFGNFFCGWFCPMGTTIDFFDRILPPSSSLTTSCPRYKASFLIIHSLSRPSLYPCSRSISSSLSSSSSSLLWGRYVKGSGVVIFALWGLFSRSFHVSIF